MESLWQRRKLWVALNAVNMRCLRGTESEGVLKATVAVEEDVISVLNAVTGREPLPSQANG